MHTGDQARIDDNGHIFITGRLKDILVLANGEKVPPGDMEMAILLDPLIEQIMVVGEARPFLSALVVVNPDEWKVFAKSLDLNPDHPDSLMDKVVTKLLRKRIQETLHEFPGYAQVRSVHVMLEPWTVENGLITPTMKVKRPKVLAAFEQEITAMYDGHLGC